MDSNEAIHDFLLTEMFKLFLDNSQDSILI